MIELEALEKRYGEFRAVADLSLRVEAGECLVLLGESGCGKTTTLKMVNRLIEPSAGRVRIAGQDTREIEPYALRRRIGYGFQRVGLFPHLSVAENIAVTPRLLGWTPERIAERVDGMLERVELPADEFRERAPHELSGGQQQRVGLARALAAEPEILLLDEPFGALDPITRDRLQQSFTSLRRSLGTTVVFVTHDMVEALLLGDRIGVMRNGCLVQLGSPAELLRTPADAYVAELMATPRRQTQALEELLGEALRDQLALLPGFLTAHLQLSLVALLLGAAISIPLGVAVTRRRGLEPGVLGFASVVQTIPSLAMLAIMVPALAALGGLTARLFGFEIRSIGYLPAILALTLYSVLPILRNTVTGIEGVDPALVEAARGVGMTPRQRLFQVELPLALPVMVAGLRTATVWVVGITTLSTPVGATSLGNYIFSGLQTRNFDAVLVGCVASALLAILLDQLVRLLETGLSARRRGRVVVSAGLLAALTVYAAGSFAAERFGGGVRPVRIGAKAFTEQYILGELMARWIAVETGHPTEAVSSLGSSVAFDAVRSGEIDVYADYSGTIWATLMKRETLPERREDVMAQVEAWLLAEHGIHVPGPLGFENAYALGMRREQAERLGLRRIGDLARVASRLAIGGDLEFFARAEWSSLQAAYGLVFRERRSMDPALMYQAVAAGQVDVISAFTTDGRIAAFDLVLLEDERGVIPPYDTLMLASPELAAARPEVLAALARLAGRIDEAAMQRMNLAVDREGRSPAEVAREFLAGLDPRFR